MTDANLAGVSLSDWIRVRAKREPGRTAVIGDGRRLTYKALDGQVERTAARLSRAGLGEGALAAAQLPNVPEFAAAFFALQRVGAAMLPLSPELRPAEVRELIRDAAPDFVIRRVAGGLTADRRSEEGKGGRCADRAGSGGGPAAGSDAPALCLYSSGSTGAMKRIMRTRRQLAAEAECFRATADTGVDDVILCTIPLVHAHGFSNCLLASIYAGSTLVLHESFDRRKVAGALAGDGITLFPGAPFIFRALAAGATARNWGADAAGTRGATAAQTPDGESAARRALAPALRLCFSAGAPLPRAAFEAFLEAYGAPVRQLYGTSETGAVTLNLDRDPDETWDSVGAPLAGIEVVILGPEGEAVPSGVEGDVGIRSPGMFNGDAEGAGVGRSRFRGPYFLPGDRGRLDSEGRLYLTGRTTTFINVGGRKVDPAEVEGVLGEHPGVEEAAVVGIPLPSGEEAIKAVVVPAHRCTAEALLAHCRSRLAAYKLPQVVEFWEELPRSALGKLLREQLQRPLEKKELA